ncbi:MAG TPA: hypothetical protein VGB73_07635 [Pyrinomonadaceae bacterium]
MNLESSSSGVAARDRDPIVTCRDRVSSDSFSPHALAGMSSD